MEDGEEHLATLILTDIVEGLSAAVEKCRDEKHPNHTGRLLEHAYRIGPSVGTSECPSTPNQHLSPISNEASDESLRFGWSGVEL